MANTPRNLSVLLVEDSKTQREAFRQVFQEAGFAVGSAATGEEALESLQKSRPDCVVLDMILPDTDGRELCKKLRSMPELASIPIVILTTVSATDAKVRALAGGADDYVPKTAATDELVARVRRQAERLWSHEETAEAKRLETLRHAAFTLAHGINNPLQVLSLCFEMLEEAAKRDSSVHDLLGRMRTQLDRVCELVWGLQRASRVALDPDHGDCGILEMPKPRPVVTRRADGRYRALIAMDDRERSDSIRRALVPESRFRAVQRRSVHEALQEIAGDPPDLILLLAASLDEQAVGSLRTYAPRAAILAFIDGSARDLSETIARAPENISVHRFDAERLPEQVYRALERQAVPEL